MKKHLRKPLRRLLSLALIGTLVSQSTLQNVSAKGSVPKGTETAVAAEAQDQNAAQPQILNEIAENRSYFSKEYLLSDNSREILVYPQQIHYQTEDGVLAEIDNSLIPTEDGYQNGSNSYELVVTDNQDSQGEVIYREGDYEIAWQMVELAENAETDQAGADELREDKTVGEALSEEAEDAKTTESLPAQDDAETGEETSVSEEKFVLQEAGKNADKQADKAEKKAERETAKAEKMAERETAKAEKKAEKLLRKPKLHGVVTHNLPAEASFANTEILPAQEMEVPYQPKQSKITFDGYAHEVTVEYEPAGDGVKENIILPDQEAGSEYLFSVRMSGLKARLTSGNEIEFYDENTGETKYYFPAPFLIDSNGETSYEARYEIVDMTAELEPEETASETEPATETDPAEETESAEETEPEATTETEPESATETEPEAASASETSTENEPTPEPGTETGAEPAPETEIGEETDPAAGSETEIKTAPGFKTMLDFTPESGTETEESAAEPETESAAEPQTPSEPLTEEPSLQESIGEEPAAEASGPEPAALYLKIVADEDWLAQASYPVTLDPVLKQYRAKNLIDSGCVVSDGTTRDDLYVGTNNTGIFRSYVSFALPQIPAQSIISEAVLDCLL